MHNGVPNVGTRLSRTEHTHIFNTKYFLLATLLMVNYHTPMQRLQQF